MKPRTSFVWFAALLILSFALPAFAQKETGTILGTVTDPEGAPLPGVTVISVSAERGSTTTYSDQDGHFRFPALPPGTYEIRAELSGFQKVSRKNIRLYVGNSLTVDMSLEAERMAETLEITGEAPLIDVTTTATSHTVPAEAVQNLPKVTFALDLFTLTPGVNGSRIEDYVAYGAGADSANSYWFDGVDVSDPEGGTPWMFPNYNWIEEVQVIGIGAPAEYGGFTGVVSNSVSRSGTNEFHGLIEAFFQNDSLTGENSDDPNLLPPRVEKFWDTTAQIGGPIIRDKFWFFTGVQYFTRDDAPAGFDGITTDVEPRWIGKVTYKLNQDNTLQGFAEWDRYDLTGRDAAADVLPEATVTEDAPEYAYNGTWISLLSPETVLDARFGGFWGYYYLEPLHGQTPGHFDGGTGIYSVNAYYTYLADRTRNQGNISLSHYARDFIKGDHDFKFGAEFERSTIHSAYYFNGGIYYYDYLGAPYYRYLWNGYDVDAINKRISAYAQDSWNITDKLNLAIGIRWDHNRGELTRLGTLYKSDPVAPRLGFTYDVTGDHKTVVKAHYGLYYEDMFTTYYSALDTYDDFVTEYFDGTDWVEVSRVPHIYRMDPDIKQPYIQQFTVGVDKELPGDIAFGAHYIYRKWKDIIDDVNETGVFEGIPFVNPLTGETITVFNQLNPGEDEFVMTNPPGLERRYNAIEFFLNRRMTKNLYVSTSYVYSRARGNTGNTSFSSVQGNNTGLSNLFNDPNFNINIEGRLLHDPTHEFKVQSTMNLPLGINSSLFYRYVTHDTWTPRINVRGLDQGSRRIFGEPRGSRRLPKKSILDFRIEKEFGVHTGKVRFTLDIFNVFNTGYPLSVESRFGLDTFGQPLDLYTPREIRLGARYTF